MTRAGWSVVWCLCVLGSGCSAAAPAPAETTVAPAASSDGTRGLRVVRAPSAGVASSGGSTERSAAAVHVRVEARRHGQPVEFRPGATLRSGDRLVMYVRSDADGWLNVVQFYPDGTSGVLSSQDGSAVQVRAGEETRIPSGGDELELDDVTGEENVYVVASARPLAEVDQAVSRLVDDVRTSGAPPAQSRPSRGIQGASPHRPSPVVRPAAPAPRPSPDLLAGLSRGMRVVPARGAVEAESEPDARGVAVVRVSFRHE